MQQSGNQDSGKQGAGKQASGKQGAIAAGHPETAEAGRLILEAGGNAFDAAVAATLAACVVEPMLTSIGGGGFLLAAPQHQKPILFDFFTQTPRQKRSPQSLDFYPVQVNFGDATQEFHIGLGSMAVPGTLAGLLQVHQRLGRLPRRTVFEPAIHLAKTGVAINPFQAYCIQILTPILTRSPAGQAIYQQPHSSQSSAIRQHPPADPPMLQTGDRLHLPDLALALEEFAATGSESLYQGDLAQQLIRDCQDQGGHLTRADLQHYQVVQRSPLRFSYGDHTLLTNPPPSSGGALIAFALTLLNGIALDPGFGSFQHLSALLQTMRLTNAARRQGYDDQLYEPNVAEALLHPDHVSPFLAELWRSLPQGNNRLGSTTHISVIDGEGNAASVTSSNGEGSGYWLPGSGIMVNNMLGEADLNPQGFHQWQSQRRLSSMMAPTLVIKNGQPEIAIGSGGSNRIRTAILQVLINLLAFNLPLEEAVNSPRMHWEAGVLNYEPGWAEPILESLISDSINMGDQVIPWTAPNMFFGGVHAVQKRTNGDLQGAGDPRRCGAFAQIGGDPT